MEAKKDIVQLKLFFLAAVFISLLLALWARAFYVQIFWGPQLAEKADRQYWNREEVQGRRGEILDREGRLLAKSVRSSSVFVRPSEVKDPRKTAAFLARILNAKQGRLLRILKSKKKFAWIAKGISDKQVHELQKNKTRGVYLTQDRARFYPQSHLAGQLLGFVGLDGEGLEGLEKSLNETLRGETARYIVQKDAAGFVLYGPDVEAPVRNGQNVFLTIDSLAQFVAEDSLVRRIREVQGAHGSALVIDAKNGEILAWANYPFFNPNAYSGYGPFDWRNRIALDNFEPGSTLKPFLIAAALQEKICSASSAYFCENGKWNVGGSTIRDTHEYGWMSVDRILRFSSNIGCAKIGLDLGAKRYHRYLSDFGFTESCHLPLPGEGQGLIAAPGRWRKLDLAAASFGQSVAVTSLQLARAYLCLLNGGRLLPLRLLAGKENVVVPEEYAQVVSPAVAKEVVHMLERAVAAEGTGVLARLPGVRVGGKTGTAQKVAPAGGYGKDYLASFVGFLPADDPQYLILVTIDSPKTSYYGSVVTIPVFREIAQHLLTHSAHDQEAVVKNPARIKGNMQGRIVSMPQTLQVSERIPDLRGLFLRQAVECAVKNGVLPEIQGEGTIVEKHWPDKGQKWGKKMVLWLGQPRTDKKGKEQ